MLLLQLTQMDADQVVGDYEIDGKPNRMPPRALFMAPEAGAAFREIADVVEVSDMYRTPESSLSAVKRGRGALPPGWSPHGFGEALDLKLKETMRNLGKKLGLKRSATKAELDAWMETKGFFCLRRDHTLGAEAWHYNFLGVGFIVPAKAKSTFRLMEAKLLLVHGAQLAPDPKECQRLLAKLKMYGGAIDGDIGPISREAIAAFQRAWRVKQEQGGKLGIRTRRTLAFVARTTVVDGEVRS